MVHMAWVAEEHEKDELDYPIEDGTTTIYRAIGLRVLWNKADIVLLIEKSASKPAQPSSSPPSSPSDDDNAGGLARK